MCNGYVKKDKFTILTQWKYPRNDEYKFQWDETNEKYTCTSSKYSELTYVTSKKKYEFSLISSLHLFSFVK